MKDDNREIKNSNDLLSTERYLLDEIEFLRASIALALASYSRYGDDVVHKDFQVRSILREALDAPRTVLYK